MTHITRAVEVNPSTRFDILRTLIQEDFVQFDAIAKRYQLSRGLVALAQGAMEHSPELQLLKPRIEAMAREHHVFVAVWRKISEDRIMLAAAAESDAPVRIHARVGARSPLLLGASGPVFAAYSKMSRAALRERFSALRLSRPLDFNAFLKHLALAPVAVRKAPGRLADRLADFVLGLGILEVHAILSSCRISRASRTCLAMRRAAGRHDATIITFANTISLREYGATHGDSMTGPRPKPVTSETSRRSSNSSKARAWRAEQAGFSDEGVPTLRANAVLG